MAFNHHSKRIDSRPPAPSLPGGQASPPPSGETGRREAELASAGRPQLDYEPARPAKGNRLAPDVIRGGGLKRFIVLILVGTTALMLAMGCVNAIVDPLGTVGTGILPTVTWTDRSLKVGLLEALDRAPGILVLGSSRAMKIEPPYLEETTGRGAFNAAVSSGRPLDAWAFTNLVHDRWPEANTDYLWMLDVETFREWPPDPGLLNTPALARYLSSDLRWRTRIRQLALLFSWSTGRLSLQSLQKQLRSEAGRQVAGGSEFDADGFRREDYHDRRRARGVGLGTELPKTIRQGIRTFRDEYTSLSSTAKADFERTLRFMNELDAEPVLVVSPTQPDMLSVIGPLGWNARHRQVLAYLGSLEVRYRFHILDFARVESFAGSPTEFYDGYHMTVANTRRLVDAVLQRLPGALR